MINYIKISDREYLSREFEFTDREGNEHCFVVADEAMQEVIEEDDDVDIGIYGYMPISFFVETLGYSDQEFAEALDKHIDIL